MAELKARISLDSSQFKRALSDITKAANKATKDIGGIGKSAGLAGKTVGAGALALGAVLVGKNAKAFTEVRNASVALGASVAVVAQRFQHLGPTIGKAFSSGKNAIAALKAIGSTGSASLKLLGNSFSFVASVAKGFASQLISAFSRILSFAGKIGGAVAGVGLLIGGALSAGIKGAVDFGASLVNLSARTGAPIKDLAILGKAFESVGIEGDKVGPAINKMQKALSGVNDEGNSTVEALHGLGLNIKDLRSKSPTEQFNILSQALSRIKDPADRAAIAMDLFGKSGGELNALFQNPEAIKNAQRALGGQADLLAKNAEKFKHVSEALKNIGDKIRGFFVGIASGLIDKLTAVADLLNKIDLSDFGKRIGDSISSALNIIVNAFKQGKLGELIGLTLKAGFATAGDYLIGAISASINILAGAVRLLFSEDFFIAIETGFSGVALKVQAAFVQAFSGATSRGAAGLSVGMQKALEVFNEIRNIFSSIAAYFVAAVRTGIQGVISILPDWAKPAGFKKQSFAENLKEEKGKRQEDVDRRNDFHAESYEDALKEQQSQYQPAFVKSLNALSDESLKAAGEAFGRLGTSIADVLKRNMADLKPGDVFHSAEIRAELEALAKSLNVPIETVKKVADSIAATPKVDANKAQSHHHIATEVDQFARIGLFARATRNNTVDHARQTAQNTGKLVQLFEAHLGKAKGTAVAA